MQQKSLSSKEGQFEKIARLFDSHPKKILIWLWKDDETKSKWILRISYKSESQVILKATFEEARKKQKTLRRRWPF